MPASDYPRTGQCVKIYPMARKYFNPLLLLIYIFKVGYRTKKAPKKVFLAALYYDLKTLRHRHGFFLVARVDLTFLST